MDNLSVSPQDRATGTHAQDLAVDFPQHPLSAAFPAMSAHDFSALVESIKTHGQRVSIKILDGMVLDGWHRYRACLECGKEPWTELYTGGNAERFVIELNLLRRHLDASQRAAVAVAVNGWRTGAFRPSAQEICINADLSSEKIASQANVSVRTVEQAKIAHKAGLSEQIRDGKASAQAAEHLVKKAPELAKQVASGERDFASANAELKARAPAPAKPPKRELPTVAAYEPPARDYEGELSELHGELAENQAELIALRAGSIDPVLQSQAREEINGILAALAEAERELSLERTLHNALKAQQSTYDYQLNDWKRRCASLERKLAKKERGL